jgi:hypothetical protein
VRQARSGDQHVISSRLPLIGQDASRRFPHPSFSAIARYCVADLSACREPYSNARPASAAVRAQRCLQHQIGSDRSAAGGSDTKKIGANPEPFEPGGHKADPDRGGASRRQAAVSGRQAFTAFGAARSQDSAAGGRRHPRPEAVATLANKLTGLVSALHRAASDLTSLSSGAGYIMKRPGMSQQGGNTKHAMSGAVATER